MWGLLLCYSMQAQVDSTESDILNAAIEYKNFEELSSTPLDSDGVRAEVTQWCEAFDAMMERLEPLRCAPLDLEEPCAPWELDDLLISRFADRIATCFPAMGDRSRSMALAGALAVISHEFYQDYGVLLRGIEYRVQGPKSLPIGALPAA
jgi:hypothetical protein